jgi:hypothetical protein
MGHKWTCESITVYCLVFVPLIIAVLLNLGYAKRYDKALGKKRVIADNVQIYIFELIKYL